MENITVIKKNPFYKTTKEKFLLQVRKLNENHLDYIEALEKEIDIRKNELSNLEFSICNRKLNFSKESFKDQLEWDIEQEFNESESYSNSDITFEQTIYETNRNLLWLSDRQPASAPSP